MTETNRWIPAGEALDKLEDKLGGLAAAKGNLAEMLRDGKLTARADRAFVSTTRNFEKAWQSRNLEGSEFDVDIELDQNDWRESVQWADDMERWRWPESRFVLTLKRDPIERYFIEGVKFAEDELDKLAVRGLPPAHSPRSKGGRRPDLERWEWFWMEVAQFARDDRLVFGGFPSQDKLIESLLIAIQNRHPEGKPLEYDSVKPRVRLIWKRFCEI